MTGRRTIVLKPPSGPKKHKGARSELLACAWLLGEGYEVFRSVSPHGLADLTAFKDGVFTLIDVKSVVDNRSETAARLSADQLRAGVVALHVWPDGRCRFAVGNSSSTKNFGPVLLPEHKSKHWET